MENADNGYRTIRTGDPSDWRLIMVLSATGIEAYLRNAENPTEEVKTILREDWNADGGNLLERIENAVYDHPQLLDDFSTDIAVQTSEALWAPESVIEGENDPAGEIFGSVFAGAEEDIMRDYTEGRVCLYMLTPGLKGFLQRTFPGARVRCHQTVLVDRLSGRPADMPRVYIDIRRSMADFVVFDGRKLLMAVTHEWNNPDDIRYHLYNLLDVYGLDPGAVHVSVSGDRDVKNILIPRLRQEVAYVMMTLVPGIAAKEGMSLTASLLMRI